VTRYVRGEKVVLRGSERVGITATDDVSEMTVTIILEDAEDAASVIHELHHASLEIFGRLYVKHRKDLAHP
jgi:hypothetical protein